MERKTNCEDALLACFRANFKGHAIKLKNLKNEPELEPYSMDQLKDAACALAEKRVLEIPQLRGVPTQLDPKQIQLLPVRM